MMEWAATAMPRYRRTEVDLMRETLAHHAALQPGIPGLNAEQVDEVDRAARWLEAADLYWVTRQMTQIALDASEDMPDWIPSAVTPVPYGLLAWQDPLPDLPTKLLVDRRMRSIPHAPVDAISWATFGGKVTISAYTRADRHDLLAGAVAGQLATVAALALPAADPVRPEDFGESAGLLAMIGATWTMMEMPTVADRRQVTGVGSSAARWRRDDRRVSIIDLRRLASTPADHDPEHPGREYKHRWYVRGHWRNQAHGPQRSQRRPVWVPGYIKGPDNAPLLAVERVNVWRR